MTPEEWDGCTDPQEILEFLHGTPRGGWLGWLGFGPRRGGPPPARPPDRRKLQLFACACCRRVQRFLAHEGSRQALVTSERHADGLADASTLEAARAAAWRVWDSYLVEGEGTARGPSFSPMPEPEALAALAALSAARGEAGDAAQAARAALRLARGSATPEERSAARDEEGGYQCALLRDLFNPFRPAPALAPAVLAWHGGAVVQLAQAAYEERELPSGHLDAARLAVLADMLEEAGCTDPALLGHLRSAGPHVRGCWAVDAVLACHG
jgi:hypothetical protein